MTVAYVRARASLFERLLAILSRMWLGLGSWHEADVVRFQRDAVPVLRAAQRAVAGMVAADMGQQAGKVLPPVPDSLTIDLRDGVTVEEEYRRPFTQVWYGLSQGDPLPKAQERGRVRLLGLADLDLQMTEASAARESMQAAGAKWWRRVPQGEKTCLLCIVASTQAYRVETLKPIHPQCDCAVEAQFTRRPGRVVDEDLLERAYAAVTEATGQYSTSAEVLRDLLADFTGEHSETGPILAYPRKVKRVEQEIEEAS